MPGLHDRLHATLNRVVDDHDIQGLVVSDEGGLLIDASESCIDPEQLAALAAVMADPFPGPIVPRREPRPVVTRAVHLHDELVLVAAVGDPARCLAAIDEATPDVLALVA